MGAAHILTYLFVSLKTGYISKNSYVYSRYNTVCLKLLNLLFIEGLIDGYEVNSITKRVKIKLKYINNKPLISEFKLVSLPSNKNYSSVEIIENFSKKYNYFCFLSSAGMILASNDTLDKYNKTGGQLLFGLKIGT